MGGCTSNSQCPNRVCVQGQCSTTPLADAFAARATFVLDQTGLGQGYGLHFLSILTDGQTKSGLGFDEVSSVIRGLRVPIYTIGYEANLAELGRLSSLVEAASVNADSGDVSYAIGGLLNAQM